MKESFGSAAICKYENKDLLVEKNLDLNVISELSAIY